MSNNILYIVATPIGTLSDFSSHAQKILTEVGFIICEDTRHSGKLLSHFGIKNHMQSLPVYQEKEKAQALIEKLIQSEKKTAALITDAGTPGISDPGAFLVAAAHEMGVRILNIPGPSSMACALASCGFIAPRNIFSGFLGRTQKEQFDEFDRWKMIAPCVALFFESPKRILKSLENLNLYFKEANDVKICVSREISKQFEEHKCGSLAEVFSYFQDRKEICGEFAICVNVEKIESSIQKVTCAEAAAEAIQLVYETKKSLKDCCKEIGKKYELSAKEIYSAANKFSS
jgi:16S rRNA (cytidine1402-2'-O)-methyltransferase